jgi:aspartyl-tRNA(Asn)/glutamyl-tRNA(Gln) amidotransferase subunit B
MIGRKELSSRGAKDLLAIVATDGGSPIEIARTRGLLQSNDTEALMPVIQVMLAEHPAVVAEYKAGKEAVIQFLIGQGVKVTKGAADPAILKEIIAKAINA